MTDLFAPAAFIAPLALRLVLGIVFIYHGYAKLFGSQMGGPKGVSQFFAQLGIPLPLLAAYVVAVVEFFGGIFLLAGFLTPLVSLLLAIVMLVAIITTGPAKGFSRMDAMGWEYDLALLAMAVALMVTGSGPAAVDVLLGL